MQLTHSEVQRMIDSNIPSYERDTLRELTEGVLQVEVETHLSIVTKESTKGMFSPVYTTAKEVIKPNVYRVVTNNVIGASLHKLTESQKISQNIVSGVKKAPEHTASTARLLAQQFQKRFSS